MDGPASPDVQVFNVEAGLKQFRQDVHAAVNGLLDHPTPPDLLEKFGPNTIKTKNEYLERNSHSQVGIFADNTLRIKPQDLHLFPVLLAEIDQALINKNYRPAFTGKGLSSFSNLQHEMSHVEEIIKSESASCQYAQVKFYFDEQGFKGANADIVHNGGTQLDKLNIFMGPDKPSASDFSQAKSILQNNKNGVVGFLNACYNIASNKEIGNWYFHDFLPKYLRRSRPH